MDLRCFHCDRYWQSVDVSGGEVRIRHKCVYCKAKYEVVVSDKGVESVVVLTQPRKMPFHHDIVRARNDTP